MTDIRNYTEFDPTKPHCMEDVRFISPLGVDGGGHMSCMWELDANGHCPRADQHHSAWIAYANREPFATLYGRPDVDDWAKWVLTQREARGVFDTEAHPCHREGCTLYATEDTNPWCYLDDLADTPEIPGYSYRALHPEYVHRLATALAASVS